jgi:putative Ca2+/H+ antiporter (TMEM165/GDT1 family)
LYRYVVSVKHNQFIVFCGAFAALAAMTVISTIMGVAAPMFLPRWLVHWGAVVLFIFYGITMLYGAQFMSDQVSEELEEVEEELAEMSEKSKDKNKDGGGEKQWYEGIPGIQYVNPIILQAFTLTFLAEWGDRSQIATIAMGADYNPWGIIVGASLGHGVATSVGLCTLNQVDP